MFADAFMHLGEALRARLGQSITAGDERRKQIGKDQRMCAQFHDSDAVAGEDGHVLKYVSNWFFRAGVQMPWR